jgi:hypothetical protein
MRYPFKNLYLKFKVKATWRFADLGPDPLNPNKSWKPAAPGG